MDNKFINLNRSPGLSDDSAVLEAPEVKEKIPKNIKQYLLEQIDNLLNNYSNEIPTEIIHSDQIKDGGKDYKVRMAWFSTIIIILTGIAKKYLPQEFNEEVFRLLVDVKVIEVQNEDVEPHPKASGVHITTKEEIDRADDLLRRARVLLENQ